jgi:hypothetical protein
VWPGLLSVRSEACSISLLGLEVAALNVVTDADDLHAIFTDDAGRADTRQYAKYARDGENVCAAGGSDMSGHVLARGRVHS